MKLRLATLTLVWLAGTSMVATDLAEAAGPRWGNLGPSCLPREGKMSPNLRQACHCPPRSFCPRNDDEWRTHPRQPELITSICCPPPSSCDYLVRIQQACGAPNRIQRENYSACEAVEAIVFEGEESPLDEHVEAADDYNRCTKSCSKLVDSLVEQQSGNNRRAVDDVSACFAKCEADREYRAADDDKGLQCTAATGLTVCLNFVSNPCPPDDDDDDGGGWDSDCVAAGTRIELADGGLVAIETLKPGDMVKGYNSINRVVAISAETDQSVEMFRINGDDGLIISGGHPLLTDTGWQAIRPEFVAADREFRQSVQLLEPSDYLIGTLGEKIKVETIDQVEGHAFKDRYNIAVDGDQTFIANGMVIRAYRSQVRY